MIRVIAILVIAGVSAITLVDAQELPQPSILVSRQLAELEGLGIGDEVRLATDADGTNARAFVVVGIYEPTPNPMRLGNVALEARLHLPHLLDLTRPPDTPAGAEYVEAINVALVDPETAGEFARDVNARMPGINAQPVASAGPGVGTFAVLERFHFAIAVVTIVAATFFLLALTIMLVNERRETVGVLRLIGLPRNRILWQVLLEGILIAGAGSLFGILFALASENLINVFFQWRYNTSLVFVHITPKVVSICLAIAIPLGALATVAASWALLRRNGLRLARR